MRRHHSPLALAGLVLVALTLGSGHVFARLAFREGVDVATAATFRSGGACLVLFGLLSVQATLRLPRGSEWRTSAILGALVVAQTVCIQFAVKRLPVTLAILVFYTYPFLTGLGMAATRQDRLSARVLIALTMAFGGLMLVLGVGGHAPDPIGLAAGFGAAASFAGVLVLTPMLAPGLSATLRTFFMMLIAAGLLAGASLALGGLRLPVSAAAWTGLAGLAACYALGIVGLFLLLPRLGAVQTAVVLNLEPVIVALIAVAALGEQLTAVQSLGAAIVVVAVLYFQLTGRRPQRAATTPVPDGASPGAAKTPQSSS